MHYENVLVMQKAQFVNIKGRNDSLAEGIQLLIAINEDGKTFDVIKNRFGPNSLDVPLSMLQDFIRLNSPEEHGNDPKSFDW